MCKTYRFLSCVCEGIAICVDNLAFNLVGPTTIVSQAARDHAHINLGHTNGLAIVERLNSSQKVHILLNEIGEVDQHLAAVLGGLLPPRALECLSCRRYGDVDILLCGLVDGADHFFCRRVDGLKGLSVDALDPLVVDEPTEEEEEPRSDLTQDPKCGVDLQSGGLRVLASSWRGKSDGSHGEYM